MYVVHRTNTISLVIPLTSSIIILNTSVSNKTAWLWSASELYRTSDRRLSAKFVLTFADRGCHMVSAADSYVRVLGFIDRSCYYFFQVAPQVYLRD
jgi:hypothetical protein